MHFNPFKLSKLCFAKQNSNTFLNLFIKCITRNGIFKNSTGVDILYFVPFVVHLKEHDMWTSSIFGRNIDA
jgi:hypothetical protein